jgi:hypothetical protein
LTDGERFGYVEEAKEEQGSEGMTPVGTAAEKGDPLAGDLVDDDEAGVVAAAFPGGDGGCGDAKKHGE